MEFFYDVTIKGSKDTVEFKTNEENKNAAIKGVEFGFNSPDESSVRDNKKGRIELRLYGGFNNEAETLTAIKQLSDWAKAKTDVLREVTIELKTTDNTEQDGNFSRTYHFDKMFCIDYFERTGSAKEGDDDAVGLEFELFMAQAPDYKISETKAEII